MVRPTWDRSLEKESGVECSRVGRWKGWKGERRGEGCIESRRDVSHHHRRQQGTRSRSRRVFLFLSLRWLWVTRYRSSAELPSLLQSLRRRLSPLPTKKKSCKRELSAPYSALLFFFSHCCIIASNTRRGLKAYTTCVELGWGGGGRERVRVVNVLKDSTWVVCVCAGPWTGCICVINGVGASH